MSNTFEDRILDLDPAEVRDVTAEELEEAGLPLTPKMLFDRLTEDEQNETYGIAVADAIRAGTLTVEEVVTQSGDFIVPRTAEDLGVAE